MMVVVRSRSVHAPVSFGATEPRSSWCPVAHRRGEDVPRHSPQHQTPMIQSDTRLGSERTAIGTFLPTLEF